MANEKRLIDANAFLRLLADRCFDFFEVKHTKEFRITTTGDVGYYAKTITELLDKTPTVDAVEVVRCKDCKHGFLTDDGSYSCELVDEHYGWGYRTKADDFCSYGERRTDES